MALPDYQSLMLPLLRLSADGSTHKFSDAVDNLADELGLSYDDRIEFSVGVSTKGQYQIKQIDSDYFDQ